MAVSYRSLQGELGGHPGAVTAPRGGLLPGVHHPLPQLLPRTRNVPPGEQETKTIKSPFTRVQGGDSAPPRHTAQTPRLTRRPSGGDRVAGTRTLCCAPLTGTPVLPAPPHAVPSQPPENVRALSITSDVAVISWSEPPRSTLNGVLKGYRVIFWSLYVDGGESAGVTAGSPRWVRAEHLPVDVRQKRQSQGPGWAVDMATCPGGAGTPATPGSRAYGMTEG